MLAQARRGHVSTFDVVVVGGGIAGLVAAAFAAKGGARVLCLGGVARAWRAGADAKRLGISLQSGRPCALSRRLLSMTSCTASASPSPATRPSGLRLFRQRRHAPSGPFQRRGPFGTTLLSDAEKGELAQCSAACGIVRPRCRRDVVGRCAGGVVACRKRSFRARRDDAPDKPCACAEDGRRAGASRPAPRRPDAKRRLSGWRLGDDRRGSRAACVALGARLRSSCRVASVEHGPAWRVMLADGTAVTTTALILAVTPTAGGRPCIPPSDVRQPRRASRRRKLHASTSVSRACRDPTSCSRSASTGPCTFSVHSAAARLAPDGAALVHVMRYLEPDETTHPRSTDR